MLQLQRPLQSHDSSLDSVPPSDLQAETSVLGSILIDNRAIHEALRIGLKVEHFYNPRYAEIYAAANALVETECPVDTTTLVAALKSRGTFDKIGGENSLIDIVDAVPSACNVAHYAAIVLDKSALRNLAVLGREITRAAVNPQNSSGEVIDLAERRLVETLTKRTDSGSIPLCQIVDAEIDRLKAGRIIPVINSHLIDLDTKTGGFKSGELVIVAARPGAGKTSFALTIAGEIAIRDQIPVAFFSLEMSAANIGQNILGQQSRIGAFRMRSGRLSEFEIAALETKAFELRQAPIFIDDMSGITISTLRTKARLMRLREKVGIIIVDYLQLVNGNGDTDNRTQEVGSVARGLKGLAKELGVPVIALAQVNRATEQRADKKPLLSDLRDSGEIEAHADIVILLHREGYYHPDDSTKANHAEGNIAKNRNGPTGVVRFHWARDIARFENMAVNP